jgi:hypothetical protein
MYEFFLLISDEFPRSLSDHNPLIPIWFGGTLFFIIYWALGKLNKKLNITSESNRLINKEFLFAYWSIWGFLLWAFTDI